MNVNYSEALEQQIASIRWGTSAIGQEFARRVYGGTGWFDTAIRTLTDAAPFYIGSSIVSLIEAAADGLPEFRPSLELLPTPYGFAWFDHYVELPEFLDKNGTPVPRRLRAVSWGACLPARSGDHPGGWEVASTRNVVELVVVPWCQIPREGRIIPWSFMEWRLSETQGAAVAREAEEALRDGRVVDADCYRKVFDLFGALCLFVSQSILVASEQRVERHLRKRLEREGLQHDPVVRVVELRRREHIGGKHAVESVEREWSCQWVVRGHWRQQPYPKAGVIRPLWITPYVKGPEDKPLKPPRATVFAVVR